MRGFFRNLFKTEVQKPTDRRQDARVDAREGLRILVVDDSATVVAVLGRMLSQAHYQAYSADSGEAALESLNTSIPDLIFLDIVLPGMSGFAALRALRRDPRTAHVPVIMISGNLKATEEFYGQRIGADDFMKKPFGRTEVFTRIQRLVESGRLPRREIPVGDGDLLHEQDLLPEETVPSDHEAPPDAFEVVETAQPDEPAPHLVAASTLVGSAAAAASESVVAVNAVASIDAAAAGIDAPRIDAGSEPASDPSLEEARVERVPHAPAAVAPGTTDTGAAVETPLEPLAATLPIPAPDSTGQPNGLDSDVIEPPAPIAGEAITSTPVDEPASAPTPAATLTPDDESLHPALRPEVRDPDSKLIYDPPWERE